VSTTRTVLLGQFTDEHADELLERLDEAGITSWTKSSGPLARTLFAGDWGVRIFVDADRLDTAKALAAEITGA
jgi:hypothetical protein